MVTDPNDAFSRYGLALEYRARGDAEHAIAQLEELRRRTPEYVALYYALGGLYAEIGRADDARETYLAGIAVANAQGDGHARDELQDVLDTL